MTNDEKVHATSFAGSTSFGVKVEQVSTEEGQSSLQIVFSDEGGTAWDILAFGGNDDNPHRLAKMKSLTLNFEDSTDLSSVAKALAFAAEALTNLTTT